MILMIDRLICAAVSCQSALLCTLSRRQWELPADADLEAKPVAAQLHAAPPASSDEGSQHSKLVLTFGKKEHDGR